MLTTRGLYRVPSPGGDATSSTTTKETNKTELTKIRNEKDTAVAVATTSDS